MWIYLVGGIYFIAVVPVAVVYGLYIGIVGKTVANILDCLNACRQDLTLWKLHPKKSHKDFIATLSRLKAVKSDNPWIILENIRHLEQKHPDQPLIHLLTKWVVVVVLFIAILPFRWGAGLIEGPGIALRGVWEFWRFNILREPRVSRYVAKVEELRSEILRKVQLPLKLRP